MFLSVAILVALAETIFPPALAVVFAVAWRRQTAPRVSGLLGFPLGACLFVFAWIAKQLLLIAGLHDLLIDVSTTPRIVLSCSGAGLLAGLVEESVRFGAGAFLFRAARELRPLRAAVLFGIGWGGMEAAMTGLGSLSTIVDAINEGMVAPSAWLPLAGLVERASAILLHVAFTAFAARAAASRPRAAFGIFAATIGVHAAIDAGVRAISLRDLDGANAVLLEIYFGICALAVFAIAARLKTSSARRAESLAPSP